MFFWGVAKLPVLEPAKIKVTSVLYMMVGCTELKKMVKVKFKLRAHPSAVTAGKPDFGVTAVIRLLRPEFKFPAKIEITFSQVLAIRS